MDLFFKYKYDELFNPLLKALKNLGGSGTIKELEDQIAEILNLSEDASNEIHRDSRTKLSYRLAWARNYLKGYGVLDNSKRGVWTLTNKGQEISTVDKEIVKKTVRELSNDNTIRNNEEMELEEDGVIENLKRSWEEQLLDEVKNITPAQFERLCQRFLRELGFVNVEVTGRTNDGGIDGLGILKLNGVLSFNVVFQAKRYQGTVGSSIIRDFRGAMSGRADKGIIITTGSFSREAVKESQRDGAIPIDIIDGRELVEKLKELNLGVSVEQVEEVNVKSDWFKYL